MILQKFTTPEEDRNLTIEKIEHHPLHWVIGQIWLTFNSKLMKTAKTLKGIEKEKQRLIEKWNLKEININD